MYELTPHPGLQFCILQLLGTLSYRLTINGKSPRDFELDGTDFEDAEDLANDEKAHGIQGTDASAVGLKLKLVKNTGTLEIEFTGSNGGSAAWIFKGLEEMSRDGRMYATAGVQTVRSNMVNSSMQKNVNIPRQMADSSMATNISIPKSALAQFQYLSQAKPGTKEEVITLSDFYPSKKRKVSQTNSTSGLANVSNNKWYLSLWGYRHKFNGSSSYGALRIDTVSKEVNWQEYSGGQPYCRIRRQYNIHLREPDRTLGYLQALIQPC